MQACFSYLFTDTFRIVVYTSIFFYLHLTLRIASDLPLRHETNRHGCIITIFTSAFLLRNYCLCERPTAIAPFFGVAAAIFFFLGRHCQRFSHCPVVSGKVSGASAHFNVDHTSFAIYTAAKAAIFTIKIASSCFLPLCEASKSF